MFNLHRLNRLLAFVVLLCIPLHRASALYQEYQLAGSIAAAPGYSFATAQYRLYANEALLKKDFLAFEYDLDSLYTDYAYALSPYVRLGVAGKAHVFDYQNLNHIVDAGSGAETKSVSLNAPYWRGQFYGEARYHAFALRYLAGAQRYYLSGRETANTQLTVASPGIAVIHGAQFGYWNLSAPRSYAFTGLAAFVGVEAQHLNSPYIWQNSGVALSASREQVTLHELHLRAGEQFAQGTLFLMAAARAGAANFSLPGESQDVLQSFSVGGPEARYRRLAGYSFSEFRVPAFGLVNIDAIIRAAGPVSIWVIADAAVFDPDPWRPAAATGFSTGDYTARRFHAGAGFGLIIDLPDGMLGSRSAFFTRAEMPFFAAGGNRFQVFVGLNGQVS